MARKLGIAPGTLTSLRKNRLKDISAAVYAKLNEAVERQLERELAALNHELHVVQAKGLDAGADAVATVVADIERVRAALGVSADQTPPSDGDGK